MSLSYSKKIWIGGGVVVLAAAVIFLILYFRTSRGPSVETETIGRRDLVAVVSASGKIQPKRLVNISADTIGRVTRLAVEEGDEVKMGQFLLQIDPELLASAVQSGEARLQAAREAVTQARVSVEASRANLDLARQNLKRKQELFKDRVLSQEVLDQAESEVTVRESELKSREAEIQAQEQRLQQEIANLRSARHSLSKVTIEAPMDGRITQLNIEEGETVLVGTMNNPGTVLMTVADMSVIQAELEVDETDIVDLRLGQPAKVVIDAFPDDEYEGVVTKIGSSVMLTRLGVDASQQATNFEVVVTLDKQVPGGRPGFSCTADITTATRKGVLAVPIQALTVRELERDAAGQIVRNAGSGPKDDGRASTELAPGHNRKEEEGVFVVRDRRAAFTPIGIGIAGERYFEVLSGLEEGDRIVTGPFSSVREIEDGTTVTVKEPESQT